jgi:nucleoside-diphosphate-sugar epimerase
VLTHLNSAPRPPSRTIVLGAGGFIGGAIAATLRSENCNILPLTRADCDLLFPDAGAKLAELLQPDDALVVVSARAPVKSDAQLIENLQMMAAVTEALRAKPPIHVLYISSDAVYADSDSSLTESSPAAPASLHGVMHLAREVMLANAYTGPLCVLRPTLVYGPDDPHNGYGPNRFMRDARAGRPILLFGKGEERRDHILVDDVATLALNVLMRQSKGVLNAVTGDVVSFREIAEIVVALHPVAIESAPRTMPMPHRGYRPFDAAACHAAFPDFCATPIEQGLAGMRQRLTAAV